MLTHSLTLAVKLFISAHNNKLYPTCIYYYENQNGVILPKKKKGNEHLLREIITDYKGFRFLGLAGIYVPCEQV